MSDELIDDREGHEGFCRDCLHGVASDQHRCGSCGSPRTINHLELSKLQIAHIDCDSFYASVEKRDNPELASLPVIIGGGKRGVVSTCCYIARIRGVRSAMPMFKALKACPDAVVIKPNMNKYVEVGKQIRTLMKDLTPLVEPLSIDEAFLDLSGTARLHGTFPARVLATFANRIEAEVGVSVSIGLSYCKFLAKVASDLEKPRGFSVIGQGEAMEFLRQQPVSLFWGVGKATQAMLARDGITHISTIQDMEESVVAAKYGSIGLRIAKLSMGRDFRKVETGGKAKSVSSETTFNSDISDFGELQRALRKLSEQVSARLKGKNLAGQTVVLKLKTAGFKSRTRNRTLVDPTRLADRIFRHGSLLLEKETDGTKFRLLGIGVTSLSSDELADPDDLVDEISTKRARAELAIDDLRKKFGDKSIEHGLTLRGAGKPRAD